MEIIIFVWVLSLIFPILHLAFTRHPKTSAKVIETVLFYQLIFSIGFGGLLGFYAHTFMADRVAEYIGWPPENPFQQEVAYANLTFGILGILCIWFRGNFWTATVVGASIWFLANAYGHLRQMLIHSNYSPGNVGIPLYADIILPIIWLGLLATYGAISNKRLGTEKEDTE